MTSSYTFVGKTTLTKSSAYLSFFFSSANMDTLTTINMYWQHARSATEIWGRDKKRMWTSRGGRNKEFGPFGDEIQIWSCIHTKRRRPPYNGHNVLKNQTLFRATFRLNVHICICAVSSMEFWILF